MYSNQDIDAKEKELKALRDNLPPKRDQAQKALNELAKELDMDGLVLDRNDTAELIVDGELPVSLNWFAALPGLVATTPMPEAAADDPRTLARVLQANQSWALTHGGTFAKLPTGNDLVLCRLLLFPTEITQGRGIGAAMADDLARFVALAKEWRATLIDSAESSLPPAIDQPPPGFIRP